MIILPQILTSLSQSDVAGTVWVQHVPAGDCPPPWLDWLAVQRLTADAAAGGRTPRLSKKAPSYRVVTTQRPWLAVATAPSEDAALRQILFLSDVFRDCPHAPDATTLQLRIEQALRERKAARLQRRQAKKNRAPAASSSLAPPSDAADDCASPLVLLPDSDGSEDEIPFADVLVDRASRGWIDLDLDLDAAGSSVHVPQLDNSSADWPIPSSALPPVD